MWWCDEDDGGDDDDDDRDDCKCGATSGLGGKSTCWRILRFNLILLDISSFDITRLSNIHGYINAYKSCFCDSHVPCAGPVGHARRCNRKGGGNSWVYTAELWDYLCDHRHFNTTAVAAVVPCLFWYSLVKTPKIMPQWKLMGFYGVNGI